MPKFLQPCGIGITISILLTKKLPYSPAKGSDSASVTLFEVLASEDVLPLPPFIPTVSANTSEKCAWVL